MSMGAGGEILPALERYFVEKSIGWGKYGCVFLAVDKLTGDKVALKRVLVKPEEGTLKVKEGDGELYVPATIAIEIKLLRMLHDQHVVRLLDVVYQPTEIFLVFEYMEHDLCGLVSSIRLTPPQIKCLLRQMLEGIHYCHVNRVIHRDIKSANILVNSRGELKIADFGMAAPMEEHANKPLPCGVVTLWNRPPELFLGFSNYSYPVDMWSFGCVFGEMLTQKPLMAGISDQDQLYFIFDLCGTPDERTWPGVSKSSTYRSFMRKHTPRGSKLRAMLRDVDPLAVDLLEKMLELDPAKRITPLAALDSEYLWSEPVPCGPRELPVDGRPCNELQWRTMIDRKRALGTQEVHHRDVKRQRVDAPPPAINIAAGIRVPPAINVPAGVTPCKTQAAPAAKSSSRVQPGGSRKPRGVAPHGKAPPAAGATPGNRGSRPAPGGKPSGAPPATLARANSAPANTGPGTTVAPPSGRTGPAGPKVEKGQRVPATLAF